MERKCKVCGKKFKTQNERTLTCGHKCGSALMWERRYKVIREKELKELKELGL